MVAELDGERLVWGSVPVEAGGVVAAQRDLDLVARPEQRGYRQELHGDVEVLPGLDGQPLGPGEAPGHAEPRGLGRSGRRAVEEPEAAFGEVRHGAVRRDVLKVGVDSAVGSGRGQAQGDHGEPGDVEAGG